MTLNPSCLLERLISYACALGALLNDKFCLCLCVRERKREGEGEKDREREREGKEERRWERKGGRGGERRDFLTSLCNITQAFLLSSCSPSFFLPFLL